MFLEIKDIYRLKAMKDSDQWKMGNKYGEATIIQLTALSVRAWIMEQEPRKSPLRLCQNLLLS